MDIGFVCLMGVGTVFVGLICIILLCKIVMPIVRATEKKTVKPVVQAPAQPVADIPDRQRMLAAVCAAIAEELGTDVSALKVISFKKL